eukprot:c22185_g1_i1 orf=356-1243(-)
MKSGVVKQKWTLEEEAALRAGVEKYGAGKWRAIQKDADYGACLISRSNVDLKDKWRNMSVSANGLGSREKAARILAAKMKQVGTTHSQGEIGSEMKVANAHPMTVAAKDKKLLGARFDHLILEAVTNLKDSNGGSKGQIASYLESHYPVPSNFKRLLAAKLKFLIQQGKLTKMRRNYSTTPDTFRIVEGPGEQYSQESAGGKQPLVNSECQASEEAALKHKSMAADEAAQIAAQAVADAEAAAAAAEEAARVAEIAEAEWEAAEAAAELATALASGSSRSFNIISSIQGGFAVPV